MKATGWIVAFAAGWAACAAPAFADGDLKSTVETLERRLREQERRIQELEGNASTRDEVAAAVDQYVARTALSPQLVAEGDAGKAGWPMGGAPFIQQGDNKLNIKFRNQVRYSAFLYSEDAIGTVKPPPTALSGERPHDRSGWELERLFVTLEGQVFCPAITFSIQLNFDSDQASGVEKEFAWLDWKYSGDHHVRAGNDKVAATHEEQTSSALLAFVDRNIYTKGFALDSDTGVMLWGTFGDACCPKRFFYKLFASTGEGPTHSAGSVFNTDAFNTYSDQVLFSGCFEWNITCKDWKWDQVDNRCEDRCGFDASLGVWAYHENDDDPSQKSVGLALRSSAPLERTGYGAWFRARYNGWTLLAEAGARNVEYTAGSTSPEQTDYGASLTLHHRFACSSWGVGARGAMIWLDEDYDSLTVGADVVPIDDVISEFGFVINYFFYDHGNKISADVNWVQDNTAVRSSSAGYLWGLSQGVVVEDGIMIRLQWQISV
jgi:hypothetical protein